ncbi:MAG: hypothetical protein KAH21_02670 [Spirochaetaceae bacterium]|nr:hypothetical protein [Spirochaetaceae bacterium]
MKNRTSVLITALLSLFFLAGCITKAPIVALPEIVKKSADLTITLKPLSYDFLKERHGSNLRDYTNPFIDFPGQIPQRRIVVFETTFATEVSTIDVFIREILLNIGGQIGQTGKAVSAEYLSNLWLGYIEDTPFEAKLPRKAHDNMLPRKFTIKPGEPVSGYLVFAERYPKEGGEGFLSIPVTADNGDRGTIEIEMFFSENGLDTERPEANTGMFNEEAAE